MFSSNTMHNSNNNAVQRGEMLPGARVLEDLAGKNASILISPW